MKRLMLVLVVVQSLLLAGLVTWWILRATAPSVSGPRVDPLAPPAPLPRPSPGAPAATPDSGLSGTAPPVFPSDAEHAPNE